MKKILFALLLLPFYNYAQVTAGFTAPDTICINTPLTLSNTSHGASSYFWNFCVADLNAAPTLTNLGNVSGTFSGPVFMDYALVNGNYYGFVTNHTVGGLIRLDFGNSLLNTPTATNLGSLGGLITTNYGTEGMQLVSNEGRWYVIIVNAYVPSALPSQIIKVDLGPTITNPAPTATNWGNLGNMYQPIDFYLFKDTLDNNWYGFTTNALNNTITRFNFTNSFNNTPTAVNMGNIGGLDYPTGIYAVNDNGFWRVFVTNQSLNPATSSLTRLDFGSSLLNTPSAVNLGNINGSLHGPRDFTIIKSCGQIFGFAVDAYPPYDIAKLDFQGNLAGTPVGSSLGNYGLLNFPHSISRLFRVNENLYGFITDVNTNSLLRLQFTGCSNANNPNSTLQTPAPITYNSPGTYNINLTVDDGLPTQDAYCKQVVVLPAPVHLPAKQLVLCKPGDSIKVGASTKYAQNLWNDGITTSDSIVIKTAGTYWVQSSLYGCSNRDSFVVINGVQPSVFLGNDTSACVAGSFLLDAGNSGSTYLWQDGSTGKTYPATTTGKYFVTVTSSTGCTAKDTIQLTINQKPAVDFSLVLDPCNPLSVSFSSIGNSTVGPWWSLGDGNTVTGTLNPVHVYPSFNTYTVRFSLQNANGTCTDTVTKSVAVNVALANIITTPDTTICAGSTKKLFTQQGALSYCWSPTTWLDNAAAATPTTSTPQNITYFCNATIPGSNLIVNGDFNAGNSGFTSGYIFANPNITEGQYFVGTNPQVWNPGMSSCGDHTTGSTNMLLVNGASVAGVNVWTETVNVTPNTNYAFSTWIEALYPPNPAQLQFSINGKGIGTPITASLPTCTWSQFYTTWNSGNNTTATISILNQNTQVQGNDFALDDISFAPLIIKRDSVVITVETPVIKTSNDTTVCSPASIQLNTTGGATYAWTPSTGLSNATIANPVATPAASTQYIVTGTTAHGCLAKDTVLINVNLSPVTDFSLSLDPCNPLSVSFASIGNSTTNPYWSFGDGATTTGTVTPVHVYPSFGNYTVKFSLQNSGGTCTDTVTKSVVVNVALANIITTPDTTICIGSTKQLFTQSALGYCWTPATYLDNPASAAPITSTPQNITYYCSATVPGNNLIVNGDFSAGNSGFTSGYLFTNPNTTEGQYFVGVNPQAWNGGMSRCGDHTTGNSNMLIVNGAPAAGVNVWTETVNVTPNTNYAFSTWIESVSGTNPALLQFSINNKGIGTPIMASLPTCNWAQFYTTWNSGSNTSATISILNQNTLAAGNDFALDDISFSPLIIQRDSVVITVETPVVKTNNDTTICNTSFVQLNASGGATYTWTPSTGLSNATAASPKASPATTTQYIVAGTTTHGCTAKDTVLITVNPLPTIVTGNDTTICHNSSGQLSAQGGVIYAWSPASSLSNPAIANPVASPVLTTTYTVIVTDNNTCTDSAHVTITVQQVPLFTVSGDATACMGTPVQLKATGGNLYTWTPSTGLDNPASATPVATPGSSTAYQVKIVETTCKDSTLLGTSLAILPVPEVTAQKSNDIDCALPFAQLSAAGAVDYSWSPGLGLSDSTIANPVGKPKLTTLYTIKGIGANGCAGYDTLTLNVTKAGELLFNVPNAFTPNGDGHNDCFGIGRYSALISNVELSIFNRWGTMIFHTTNPSDCWDGRYRGELQSTGGYPYVIKASTLCGVIIKKGIVMLIK